ncbi:Rpn family recombination-promoting nuclease/putative transposase [Sodalis endosymbiont of Spalangia cameroni]|uniref:Rpn family recombination-promoting nuclease/putative transposase n=1 Tax=Sodalis praecaptivus TaxID=1239307 RepID=UPI0031F9F59B
MSHSLSHHDAMFKKFLGDIEVARDFMEIHLPSAIRARCDLSSLAMAPGSFVEADLRHQLSDMLYQVQTSAGTSYIYCLIEHQSRPEKLMPHRLLRYSLAAMQRHLEQGNDRLPVVVPLLFYHGRTSPYPYSMRWLDCFADPVLAEWVYGQAFPLVDVTALPDDEILTHRRVALLELVQKHIRTRDMLEMVQDIARLVKEWSLPKEQFRSLMYYIVMQGNTPAAGQFLQMMAEQAGDYQEDVMTIAEQLRQEGERRGLQQGMQQGLQQGLQQGMQLGKTEGRQEGEHSASLKIARQLIANGIDHAVVKLSTGLTDVELDMLTHQ